MSTVERFVKSFFWNLLIRFSAYFFGFFLSVIIARGLSQSMYGTYASITSIISLVLLFTGLGFEDAINIYLPRYRVDEAKRYRIHQMVRELLVNRVVICTLASLVLFFSAEQVAGFIGRPEADLFVRVAAWLILLTGITDLLTSIFKGALELKVPAVTNLLTQALNLGLVYFFLAGSWGVVGIFWANIITLLAVMVVYFLKTRPITAPVSGPPRRSWSMREIYTYGLHLALIKIGGFGLGKQIDIILMNFFQIPLASVGAYNIAFGLSLNLGFLAHGTGPLAQSACAEIHQKHGLEGLARAWSLLIKLSGLAILPLLIFCLIYARELITVVYSEKWIESIAYFYVFAGRFMISVLCGAAYASVILYTLRMQKQVMYATIFSGIVNLLLDLVLIPFWGAWGAVLATGFSSLVVSLYLLYIASQRVTLRYPWRFMLKMTASLLAGWLVSSFIIQADLWKLMLGGFIFFGIFLWLLHLWGLFEEEERRLMERTSPWLARVIKYF